jgi:hypothetical protein
MRTVTTLLILAITPVFGVAQKVSSQVTNLTGFDLANADVVVTSSIGEPAIVTFINTDYILTQGFLQPEILPCKDHDLTYYPNPAQDDITIVAAGCEVKIQSMQLIDPWGRLIATIKPTPNNKVYLGDISPGVYFIRIFLTNAATETLKIAKVSN